jgi:hypothetical protein
MTARNAGKDERALKHGHEQTQMLITYRQTNVHERADDWKSMLPVLIQDARRDLQHGGSKKSALATSDLRKQELRNRDAEDF